MEKGKGFIAEFKKFISRGNVIDLAVGVIIGTAFTAIVNSLVNDIVMPIIGLVIGGMNFENLAIVVGDATIKYGMFIQNIINFLLIALVIFIMVKAINSFHKKEEVEPEAEEPSAEVKLLSEIRDLMKK